MTKYIQHNWLKIQSDYAPVQYGILQTIGPAFTVRSSYSRSDSSTYNRRVTLQVCQCSCGSFGVYDVNRLRRSDIKSCGCTRAESVRRTFTTHGDSGSVEHLAWMSCRSRCYNVNYCKYKHYGARGIRVCDRWNDPIHGYANFLADMGRRPPECTSLDRIDVNGNYEPGNCKWATQTEQMNNTRGTIRVTYSGETKGVVEWARQFGVQSYMLRYRIKQGKNLKEALMELGVKIDD